GIKHNGDLLKAIDCQVKSTDRKKQTAIIDITLQEGKNRHIRRMMEHLGYSVSKLSREKYGFLTLNGLQPGKYRELSKQEIHQLKQLSKLILIIVINWTNPWGKFLLFNGIMGLGVIGHVG